MSRTLDIVGLRNNRPVVVATVKELELHDEWMGECFLTVTVKSAEPVEFKVGDYIDYRGERYTIDYDPTVLKKARRSSYGDGFVYDNIKFYSYSHELTFCDFCDYVLYDNNIHFSSLAKFSFFASTVSDLADRIQANLTRFYGDAWTVVCGDMSRDTDALGNKVVRDVNVSVSDIKVWDALALVATQFKTAFFIKGRTIYIGTKGSGGSNVIDFGGKNYQYGKGKGLYEIEKVADTNQSIFTLLKVYGSDKNMPANYYADLGASVFFSVTKVESDIDDGDTQGLGLLIDNYIFAGVFTEHSGDPEYGSASYYKAVVTICKQTVTAWIEVLRNTDGATTRLVIGTDKYGTTAAQVKAIRDGGLAVGTPVYFDMDYVNKSKVNGSHIKYEIPSAVGALALPVLMLPGYPLQSLAEWWAEYKVSASRDETYCQKIESYLIDYELSTDVNQPYIRSHKSSIYGLREQSWYFDGSDENHPEIFPTITGMKRGNVDLWKVSSAQQIADNGVLGNIEKAPTFTITIPALGFKVGGYLNDDTYIAFNSGMCGGRKFKVKKAVDYDNVSVLTCERSYDSSIGKWFPYHESGEAFNIQGGDNIRGGDEYVLLGIELPKEYVENASRRALLAGLEVLAEHDHPKSTYIPRIDEIEMERERDTHANIADSLYWNLRAGQMFTFNDTDLGITVSREIATLTIKENGNNGIPTYEVSLRENDEKGTLKSLQDRVDYIESNGLPDSTGTINGNATGGTGGDSLWEVHVDETTGERTAHLRSEFAGAWTDGFLSALGKSSDGSDSGIILNEPLKGINEAGLAAPALAQKDMTLVWDGTKWGYGKTGAYTFATGYENGTFSVTPYGGQAQKVKIYGLKALAYKDTIDATLVTSGIFSADRIPGLSWNKITSDKPTTLAGYGIGDAKIANGTITLGGNSITPVTEVKMTVPTGFAVTGSPLTKTGTLALAYAAGYEGFTTALKEKIEALFSWFELDSDGNVKTKDKPNGGGHRGFWTESFVSALGKNDSQSSAFDESAMWTALGGSLTNKQIALSHLTTALSGYVKGVKVGSTTYSPNGSGIVDLGTIEGRTYTFAPGATNGTFKVTPSVGDAYEVAIKGLKALAYKASLTADDIPNLDATKITTGILSADRIPGLSADKITSGTLSVDRIPDLSGKYVTTTFFNKLFRAQDASGNDITVNASTAVDSIKAMVGLWTEEYLSALGKNPAQGEVVVLNALLTALNGSGLAGHPSQSGQTVVWNGSQWTFGTAGGSGTVTAVKVGNTTYSPTNGVVSLPAYPTSLAWGNITGKPTTLGGYGITDAKIENGVITLGTNTITPLTDAKLKSGYEWWGQKMDASGNTNGIMTFSSNTLAMATNYTDVWNDGTNDHPWYGYDHRYANTGVYSTTISDYFGLTLRTGSGYICMQQNGYVGIGTDNPSKLLHVNGDTRTNRLYLTESIYLEYDSGNKGVHLVGAGFYADTFVSALGKGDDGGASTFDESQMWLALGTNISAKVIPQTHLNLTGYAKTSDLNAYVKKVKLNGIVYSPTDGTVDLGTISVSGYLKLDGTNTMTGNIVSTAEGLIVRMNTDSSNAKNGLAWYNADGSTQLGGIQFHNTANRIMLNATGIGSMWNDKVGNYTFIVGNNELKYNTYNVLHAGNSSVSKSDETLTVKINGTEQSITNTWRGIQDNLTSDSATDSLSAKQGKALKGLIDGNAGKIGTIQGYFTNGVANSAAKLNTGTSTYSAWGQQYWSDGKPNSISGRLHMVSSDIYWKENNYGDQFAIAPQFSGTDDSNLLQFQSAVGAQGTTPTLVTRMVITGKNGYVGIGTTSPSTLLHVNGYTRTNRLYLQSDSVYFELDSDGNVHLVGAGFYSDSFISALGLNDSGSGGGEGVYIPLGGSESIAGQLTPDTDNAYNLGNGNKRWKTIYSTNATINLLSVNGTAAVNGSLTAYVGSFSNQLSLGGKAVATQEWVTNKYYIGPIAAGSYDFNFTDDITTGGVYQVHAGSATKQSSWPFDYGLVANFVSTNGHLQIAASSDKNDIRIRSYWWTGSSSFGAYPEWKTLLHSGNTYISGRTITINGTSLTVPTGAGGDYLPLTGGTLTGGLTINYNSGSALSVNGAYSLNGVGTLSGLNLTASASQGITFKGSSTGRTLLGLDWYTNSAGTLTVSNSTDNSGIFSYGGFKKSDSSDSYVLLGGGGHKALGEFVVHRNMGQDAMTGYAGSFFFSGDATLQANEDYVGFQAGYSKDKWQMIAAGGSLKWRRNDAGGTDSTGWTGWKLLLDSNNYMQYVSAINNSANAGGGSAGWLRVAIIKVNATYASQPIFMRIVQRGGYDGDLRIYFNNQNTTDPTLNSLTYTGTLKTVKFIRYTAGTWHLYIQKSENNDAISVSVRDMTPYMQARVTVTYDDVFSSSEPTGTDFSNGSSGNWYAACEESFNNGDGTMKIYGVSSGYGDERIAIQTSFDGQDPKTSTYPSSYPARACLLLQPRGGNVGIGTTSPSYTLHVNGTAAVNSKLMINGGQVTNDSKGIQINASDNSKRALFVYNGNTTSIDNAYLKIEANLGHIALMPGGKVGIGTTSPAQKLDVNGNTRINGYLYILNSSVSSTSASIRVAQVSGHTWLDVTGTDNDYGIYNHGDFYCEGYATFEGGYGSSDIRKKDIVKYVERSVEDIARAPIFDFVWKQKPNKGTHLGTSAQYWQGILPNSVVTSPDGYLAMDYGAVALASAVSVARKVVDHELRIKQLQDRVIELEKELEQLKAA